VIALASDHGGFALKEAIKPFLQEAGIPFKDFGTDSEASCDYPKMALPAIKAVAAGDCEKGILFCGTGVGMSIAANKARGIRCVLCSESFTAMLSRQHNNANMLALGGRVLGVDIAKQIIKTWLETPFEGGERHSRRIAEIAEIESSACANNISPLRNS
jgi:ribose 5-phosphate isomerase B